MQWWNANKKVVQCVFSLTTATNQKNIFMQYSFKKALSSFLYRCVGVLFQFMWYFLCIKVVELLNNVISQPPHISINSFCFFLEQRQTQEM